MDNQGTMLLVFGAVALGMIGQGWVSFLDHQRQRQTLDVIKAALQSGREPPPELYALLRKDAAPRAPWGEALVFGVLAIGFLLAFALLADERRMAFLVIGVTMAVTSLGCLAMAMLKPSRPRDDERS